MCVIMIKYCNKQILFFYHFEDYFDDIVNTIVFDFLSLFWKWNELKIIFFFYLHMDFAKNQKSFE